MRGEVIQPIIALGFGPVIPQLECPAPRHSSVCVEIHALRGRIPLAAPVLPPSPPLEGDACARLAALKSLRCCRTVSTNVRRGLEEDKPVMGRVVSARGRAEMNQSAPTAQATTDMHPEDTFKGMRHTQRIFAPPASAGVFFACHICKFTRR
jgi:hypothetical protein